MMPSQREEEEQRIVYAKPPVVAESETSGSCQGFMFYPHRFFLLMILVLASASLVYGIIEMESNEAYNEIVEGRRATDEVTNSTCKYFRSRTYKFYGDDNSTKTLLKKNILRDSMLDVFFLVTISICIAITLILILLLCMEMSEKSKLSLTVGFGLFGFIFAVISVILKGVSPGVYEDRYKKAMENIRTYESEYYTVKTDAKTGATNIDVLKPTITAARAFRIHKQCQGLYEIFNVCSSGDTPEENFKIAGEICKEDELMSLGFCRDSFSGFVALILAIVAALLFIFPLAASSLSLTSESYLEKDGKQTGDTGVIRSQGRPDGPSTYYSPAYPDQYINIKEYHQAFLNQYNK